MRVDPQAQLNIDLHEADPLASVLDTVQNNIFNGETLDAVFRGRPPGLPMLAVTNRRLMLLHGTAYDEGLALISVPLKTVSSVAFVIGEGETLDTTATVGIMMLGGPHLVVCENRQEARELHDSLLWTLIS
jgi:hypothetical protein